MIQEENAIYILLALQSSNDKRSITSKGCSLSNKLPNDIKLINSDTTFRIRLKGTSYIESL